MLELQNISKIYNSAGIVQNALDDVSVKFRDNEFVSILGTSGAGKTTLLNIIGGLDKYTGGDLIINGVSTRKYKDKDWDSYRNHSVGFVFQSYNLIPHQSIVSNVEMSLTLSGIDREERHKRAREMLKKVGLDEQRHKRPNQLSGGQMQRVAIARALINDPDILLADEPTGALDTETGIQIMDLLKEVAEDKLVIMVTHNPELATTYSNRIIDIKDGKIISDTNPYEEEIPEAKEIKQNKVSMKRRTALRLSFKNLLTKKARTILTSFAGSIGIIGICLILAVSDGVNLYIESIQKSAMSSYPISITSTALSDDLMNAMTSEINLAQSSVSENGTATSVKANYMAAASGDLLNNSLVENNLTSFKKYINENYGDIEKYLGETGIVYLYNTNFSVYSYDKKGKFINSNDEIEGNSSIMSTISSIYSDETIDAVSSLFSNFIPSGSVNFSQALPGTGENTISPVITDNYKLLYGKWPSEYNEVLLVLDPAGSITAEQLCQLGLITNDEYIKTVEKVKADNTYEVPPISFEDAVNHEMYLIPECDRYVAKNGKYEYITDGEKLKDSAVKLKISGIIAPDSGNMTMTITTPVVYMKSLTDYIVEHELQSDVVKAQKASPDINILTGTKFKIPDTEKLSVIKDAVNNLTDDEKSALLIKLFMSGKIEVDMNNIDYNAYISQMMQNSDFDMSSFMSSDLINEIITQVMSDNKSFDISSFAGESDATDEEKLAQYNEWINGASDKELKQLADIMSQTGGDEVSITHNEDAVNSINTKKRILTSLYNLNLIDKKKYEEEIEKADISLREQAKIAVIRSVLKNLPDSMKTQLAPVLQYKDLLTGDADLSSILENIQMPEMIIDLSKIDFSKYIDTEAMNSMADMNTGNITAVFFDNWAKTATDEDLLDLYDIYLSDNSYEGNMKKFGMVDENTPTSISIYVETFEAKDRIVDFIDRYNEQADEEDKISFTDFVALITSSITSIINAVSYVLIAFVGVSLVVSSIMIGVITNISVLERTKEIGILRAMGASKKNISQIFNSETLIIGCFSGILGVAISYLLLIPINILADKLTHINELRAVLQPQYAVILVGISIFVTVLGGLYPAKKASLSDPVKALRSE